MLAQTTLSEFIMRSKGNTDLIITIYPNAALYLGPVFKTHGRGVQTFASEVETQASYS